MTTTEATARQMLTDALANRTAQMAKAQNSTGRARAAAYRAAEEADMDVNVAARMIEQAVRAANPGMTEAQIQKLTRSAA